MKLGRKYLYRMAGNPMWGWKVAVPVNGKQEQHYFGDKAHGGVRKAYAAAKAFRDGTLLRLKLTVTPPNQQRFNQRHANNTSGTIGVSLQRDERAERMRVCWVAQVMMEGRLVHRGWSVRKWGYAVAFRQATAYRAKFTKQRPAKTSPPPPAWLLAWVEGLPEEEHAWILPT